MDEAAYKAIVRSLGLTPCKPSFQGATLHQDRDGHFQQVTDPDTISDEERASIIALLKWRLGVADH